MSEANPGRSSSEIVLHGVLGLAVGTFALQGAAYAAVVVNNTDQSLPAVINYGNAVQFNVGTGTISAAGATSNRIGGSPNATKLSVGTSISASQFTTSGSSDALGGVPTSPPILKFPGYVPLELVNGAVVNYGYAEFAGAATTSTGGVNGLGPTDLVGYAFESTPGTAIVTRDLAVPEPASLSLLALGAAGAAAIRRRSRLAA